MLKERTIAAFRRLREEFIRVLKQHPVELVLFACGCVGCIVAYNAFIRTHEDFDAIKGILSRVALVPLFGAAALALNLGATNTPWRWLYRFCWVVAVPLLFWSGLEEWVGSLSYAVTVGVLAPLVLLCARRASDNERFVREGISFPWALLLAVVYVGVAIGLFCAILLSTSYIFGFAGDWVEHTAIYAVIIGWTLLAPVLFLLLSGLWLREGLRSNRIIDSLVNYVVSPAVLIYMGILYIYAAKILVTWSLPKGGVAYMVFGFTILAVLTRALREVQERRMYDWFFNRFSLFVLPATVLFWWGVAQRIGEYGLTEERVWLVTCGVVMTLCLLLFLSRRTGRFRYVALAAIVIFAAQVYVPSLDPERLSVRSQTTHAIRLAERMEMLTADGHIDLTPLATPDTARLDDYRDLYGALRYVSFRDSAAFARFGIGADVKSFEEALPAKIYTYVLFGKRELPSIEQRIRGEEVLTKRNISVHGERERFNSISTDGYRKLYMDVRQRDESPVGFDPTNDTLRIRLGEDRAPFVIPLAELLRTQLARVGLTEQDPFDEYSLTARADEFLVYADDDLQIGFTNITIERTDSSTRITSLYPNFVLTR